MLSQRGNTSVADVKGWNWGSTTDASSDSTKARAAAALAGETVRTIVGMIWSVPDARFEAGLAWAGQWAAEHAGSLAAPVRAFIGGYPIGTWLAGLRAQAEVPEGEKGALEPARRAALEAIDPWWALSWPIAWQRTYAAARAWWLASDGRVDWLKFFRWLYRPGAGPSRAGAAQGCAPGAAVRVLLHRPHRPEGVWDTSGRGRRFTAGCWKRRRKPPGPYRRTRTGRSCKAPTG
ncbi:hypothetical protein ACFVT9_35980 [Kitasatospora cineracea]|uniref:hypothetical protein n=1 Tax=Kitasatospora cineracea TaxID=88074 RepID=UPI0036D9DDB2